jgi:hypothetical protein
MTIDEKEYAQFIKWMSKTESFTGFTSSQVDFAKKMFEFMADYPSFKQQLQKIGSNADILTKIEQYVKETRA